MVEYNKFKNLYDEIDILIANEVKGYSPNFQAWKTKVERFLISYYGRESYEYESFAKQKFSLSVYTFNTPESTFIEACRKGLEITKNIFKEYLDEMSKEDMNDYKTTSNIDIKKTFSPSKEVFIVHGHDGELKEAVARILEKQDIKPIILSEQANNGKTIIEKIEQYSDVGAAVILFTKDDMGKLKSDESYMYRARQNVVFESGYFIAKLGRSKVIIIKEEGIEMPSDLSGVIYTAKDNWQIEVLKELKSMGIEIDFNKLF